MADQPNDVALTIEGGPDLDATDVEELTYNLRDELLEAEAEDVQFRGVRAPPGAKADAVAIGELIVTVVGALPGLVTAIRGWLGRSGAKRIRLEIDGDAIEIEAASSEDKQRLIDAWLSRHDRAENP
jgi:hypothetical protein